MSTEDSAEDLMARDYANVVAKIDRGQPLLKHERQLVRSVAFGGGDTRVQTVSTVVELAETLGVARQTLTKWRKHVGAPKPKANGSHDVSEWREFMAKKGLKAGSKGSADDELKTRKLVVEIEEREIRLAQRKDVLISRDLVRQSWLERAGQVTSIMRAKFEKELPPLLVGLDAPAIAEKLGEAVDAILAELHQDKNKSLTP